MSTTFSLQSATSFSHAISHKLTNLNYLLWCQQVEPMLKGHHFHHFFRSPTIPARFKTLEDHDLYNVSLEFVGWEQHNQFLLLWLQSTISIEVLPRLINCKTTWHLWDKLHSHFRSLIRVKTHQL
ncbi:hypothetical protein AAZX31_14G158800 [Glycine max]